VRVRDELRLFQLQIESTCLYFFRGRMEFVVRSTSVRNQHMSEYPSRVHNVLRRQAGVCLLTTSMIL